jgi:hypothetical protein
MQAQQAFDTSKFSEADWKQLTDYVTLLISIDQRLRKEAGFKGEQQ